MENIILKIFQNHIQYLHIKEMTKNDTIYLKYSISIEIDLSLVQYKLKYKNIRNNIYEFNNITNIKYVTYNFEIFDTINNQIYCQLIKKWLILYYVTYYTNNIYFFKVYHNKNNIIKIINIIFILIVIFVLIDVIFG